MRLLSVPVSVYGLMREYLWVIFFGIAATFLYNFFACLLRAVGNSAAPLIFLGISAVLNIVLDLVCVLVLHWGVAGAAAHHHDALGGHGQYGLQRRLVAALAGRVQNDDIGQQAVGGPFLDRKSVV